MLLDAACGYGRLSVPMAKAGYAMYGIDIVPYQIELAHKAKVKNGVSIDLRVGDMAHLPYDKGFFDGIFCMMGAFQYLRTNTRQISAMDEFYRVLRPWGKLVISVDNNPVPGNYSLADYSTKDLEQLVSGSGFEKPEFTTMKIGYRRHEILNMVAHK